MPNRSSLAALFRALAACAVIGMVAGSGFAQQPERPQVQPPASQAQPAAPQPETQPSGTPSAPLPPTPLASLEPIRLALDQIEQAIGREGMTDATLMQTRVSLEPLRDDLRAANENFEGRLADVDTRLKQLGEAPKAGAQPEEPTIAAERARLTQRHAEVDGALKQARLLTLRANDLADRITDRRRDLFTRQLFTRTSSVLDPAFLSQAAKAVPDELRSAVFLAQSWWGYARDNGGYAAMGAAAAVLLAIAVGAILVLRWLTSLNLRPAILGTRFSKAFFALMTLLRIAILAPAAVGVVVFVLDGFDLLPIRIREILLGLVAAAAFASLGRGVAIGLFAPGEPDRRLIAIAEETANRMASHLVVAARVLGVVVFFNVFQRAIVGPVSLTVAASGILAIVIAALLAHLLFRTGRARSSDDEVSRAHWLRGAGWILVIGIAASLVTGYVGFAAFLAGRFLIALGALGALYILLVFTDTLFTEVLTANTARGRSVAHFFGLKPRSIELIGVVLSAVLRLVLILVVLLPLLGPWGVFAADFIGVVREATFGIRIGEFTLSLTGILTTLALVLVGVLATRAAQGWLRTQFLPRTSLDPGLQNSVGTIFGYVCIIAVVAAAMTSLGIDLQKITLVAGALSIGIGFGLQAIVSNFISGLILLAERPIRVGDVINVKGEEGAVRRIHVRATEIETADRASVIIPNSELITGVVKNWTHANTLSRIVLKVGVAYDSDMEKVRNILLEITSKHPHVLPSPAPAVLLTALGDNAVHFEIYAVVRNLVDGGGAKSDIYFEILTRFREEGIAIPSPQRELILRGEAAALATPVKAPARK
jgi:small-conductance mechanosensitive channel